MAFPTGWSRKQAIVIDSDQVSGSGSHTDFPFPITLDHLDTEIVDGGSNSALTNGDDIRFTSDSAGTTELPFEIDDFVADATEGNRRCLIWVLVPSLSTSSDTTIYIWYKNASASPYAVTDPYGRNAVWAQYEAVLPLNESAAPYIDRTGNGYDATVASGTPTSVTTDHPFPNQNWVNFDGDASSDILVMTGSKSMLDGSASMFLSGWCYLDVNAPFRAIIGNWNSAGDNNWFHLFTRPQVLAKAGGSVDEATTASAAATSTLWQMAGQHTGSVLNLYKSGVLDAQDTSIAVTSGITGAYDYRIGTYYNAGNVPDGRMGLIRAGKGIYSADWLLTEVAAVSSPSTFAAAGTPEATVSNTPPTGSPTISGTKTEGQTLTCDTSGIADADGLGTFSYQWLRDDVAISGATSSTYVLTAFDVNTVIKVRVDFTDQLANAESVTSSGYSPIAAASSTTYYKCYFPVVINPAYLDNSISGDPSFNNFVVKITEDDIPAAFMSGGSQSAENGGGNIRVYTSTDLTDASRLALKVVDFDINAGTVDLRVLIPVLPVSTGDTLYVAKGDPTDTQPGAATTYGSDAVDTYDPALVPPTDPSDLKTTYDNQDTEADFMAAGSLSCTLIGGSGRRNYRRRSVPTRINL